MRGYSAGLLLAGMIFLLTQNTLDADQTNTELSQEDQEVVQNLELLQNLDLMEEEDQELLGNYDSINKLQDNVSNSKKDGTQNE